MGLAPTIVGYTKLSCNSVREVIEANRRGTWTINALTVQMKCYFTSPVTRLTRSYKKQSGCILIKRLNLGLGEPHMSQCKPPLVSMFFDGNRSMGIGARLSCLDTRLESFDRMGGVQ